MRVRLLARQLGQTLGGGGPQRGDGMLRRLTSRGRGPGESAARAPQEVGSGPGPVGGAGRGRAGMQRPESRTEAVPLPSGR